MQLTIALVNMIATLLKERLLYFKIFYLVCVFILFAGLMQLCSKSVFFSLFILINLAVPYFLLSGRRRWKFILITASVTILSVIGIFRFSALKERYINNLKAELSEARAGEVYDSRLARWQVTGELIARSPVIGYGAGSEMSLLQQNFFEKRYYNSFLHRLNSHSQYLSFLLKSGIVGLLLYLATLVFGFKIALKKKDLLFFTFLFLITIVSFSENLLDVDKGIIFYAFFFSFFLFSSRPGKAAVRS
jgi:O-antigen ligase